MRFLFALLLSCSCFGQGMLLNPYRFSAGGGGSPTYLIKQDFEGTGYDNSESWTETGSIDEDYTTSPAPLVGSQSAFLSGTTLRLQSPSFAQDEIYLYFVIRYHTVPAGGASFFTILGCNVGMDLLSDRTVRIGGAVNSAPTIGTMAADTTYHVLVRYKKGTGANAIYSIEFQTSATFTGSGNNFTSRTDGSDTAQATAVRFTAEAGSTVEFILDKVRVDDVAIGNSPP